MSNSIMAVLMTATLLTNPSDMPYKEVDGNKPFTFHIEDYSKNEKLINSILAAGLKKVDVYKCAKFAIAEAMYFYDENPDYTHWSYDADFSVPVVVGVRVTNSQITNRWICDPFGYTQFDYDQSFTFTPHEEMFYNVETQKDKAD